MSLRNVKRHLMKRFVGNAEKLLRNALERQFMRLGITMAEIAGAKTGDYVVKELDGGIRRYYFKGQLLLESRMSMENGRQKFEVLEPKELRPPLAGEMVKAITAP